MKKYLQMSDEVQANYVSVKVASFTALLNGQETIDEVPVVLPNVPGFFVTVVDGLDISEYASYIVETFEVRPDQQVFNAGLQENHNREEDGREVVKVLVTMLDSGLGGAPQSSIAALFKEMGWVRSMLKEGFFETAYYEHETVFMPKGLLPVETLEAIKAQIFVLAKKYNPDFDGTVS